MSGNENLKDELSGDAFEYVSGTLRGEERLAFERRLNTDDALAADVRYWEEQLLAIQPFDEKAPAPKTWGKIIGHIQQERSSPAPKAGILESGGILEKLFRWSLPTVAAAVLMVAFLGLYQKPVNTSPNTDYVAVLTDESGKALLTALTAENGKSMWFKWEMKKLNEGTTAQLWAVSRRDGETRPLAVLDNTNITQLALDEAAWRLVTDAEFLVLTEEEPGGSPIDEPSDVLLAKGFCVRFTRSESPI